MPDTRLPLRFAPRARTPIACSALIASALFAAGLFGAGLSAGPAEATTQDQLVTDEKTASPARSGARTALSSRRLGRVCKTGFDIRPDSHPRDDASPGGTEPAATVDMDKSCRGAVLVRFAASLALPAGDDTISATAIARCVGHGGYANACSEGDVLIGVPDDNGVQRTAGSGSGKPVRAAQWIYSDLKPGVWKFSDRPEKTGGDVTLHGRSLSVLAFKGG